MANRQTDKLKQYFVLSMSLISAAISSIFWVQNYGENHYYPLRSGEYVENEIKEIQGEISKIRDQNTEIILMLGRIEGALGQ